MNSAVYCIWLQENNEIEKCFRGFLLAVCSTQYLSWLLIGWGGNYLDLLLVEFSNFNQWGNIKLWEGGYFCRSHDILICLSIDWLIDWFYLVCLRCWPERWKIKSACWRPSTGTLYLFIHFYNFQSIYVPRFR